MVGKYACADMFLFLYTQKRVAQRSLASPLLPGNLVAVFVASGAQTHTFLTSETIVPLSNPNP